MALRGSFLFALRLMVAVIASALTCSFVLLASLLLFNSKLAREAFCRLGTWQGQRDLRTVQAQDAPWLELLPSIPCIYMPYLLSEGPADAEM